jgi:hypothetical protein
MVQDPLPLGLFVLFQRNNDHDDGGAQEDDDDGYGEDVEPEGVVHYRLLLLGEPDSVIFSIENGVVVAEEGLSEDPILA